MLPRKHLVEAVHGILAKVPVALVTAPAGSGKSNLARSMSSLESSDARWLEVDHSGSLPADLETTLLSAGSRLVVIDGCERLTSNAASLLRLQTCLENQRRGQRVLLLSRSDLGGAFARMGADGLLGRVDGGALRFSIDEVEAVLRRRESGADAHEVHAATGGWPVAVTLSGADPDEVSNSLRVFLDYTIMTDLSVADRILVAGSALLDHLAPYEVESIVGSDAARASHAKLMQILPMDSADSVGYRHAPVVRGYLRSYFQLHFPRDHATLQDRIAEYRPTLCAPLAPAASQTTNVFYLAGTDVIDSWAQRRITLQPFGAVPTITFDRVTIEVRRTKLMELAAALTLRPGGISLDDLHIKLFPDLDRRRAGNYLRQVTFQLNQITGIRLDRAPDGSLQWPKDYEVDAIDLHLEALMLAEEGADPGARAGRLEALLRHVRGSYLVHSNLEWTEMRRYRLEVMHQAALGEASRLALDRGDYEAARSFSRTILESDPHCGASYTTLQLIEKRIGTEASQAAMKREALFALHGIGKSPQAEGSRRPSLVRTNPGDQATLSPRKDLP